MPFEVTETTSEVLTSCPFLAASSDHKTEIKNKGIHRKKLNHLEIDS